MNSVIIETESADYIKSDRVILMGLFNGVDSLTKGWIV